MDVSPIKRAKILSLRENTEKTYREITKIVGVSISTISRIVKMKKETRSVTQNAKENVVVRGKRPPEMMPTYYRRM